MDFVTPPEVMPIEMAIRHIVLSMVQNSSAVADGGSGEIASMCSLSKMFTKDSNTLITIFCVLYFLFWIFVFVVGGFFYMKRVLGKQVNQQEQPKPGQDVVVKV